MISRRFMGAWMMGDTRGGSTRARNALQHGLLWMTDDRCRDLLSESEMRMLQALIDMKEGVKGDVGPRYS